MFDECSVPLRQLRKFLQGDKGHPPLQSLSLECFVSVERMCLTTAATVICTPLFILLEVLGWVHVRLAVFAD